MLDSNSGKKLKDKSSVYKRILLKISGEAMMGDKGYGIDYSTVDFISHEIKGVALKAIQVAIVIGGGNIFRGVEASLQGIDAGAFTGPWVSDQDRSPIRRVFTKNIVRNVTNAALVYAEALMKSDHGSEAGQWIRWADRVDRESELGPGFTDRISRLNEELAKTMR